MGITQYLELYWLMNGGTVEVDMEMKNTLLKTLENCITVDASFNEIKEDCQFIAPYSLEITYPGGMKVTLKNTRIVIKKALKIEKFIKSKLDLKG